MTRAEQWLILAAAGDIGKPDAPIWYRMCEQAMADSPNVFCDFPSGPGRRVTTGTWPEPTAQRSPQAPPIAEALEDWLSTPVQPPKTALRALSPSDLGGAKALPGEADFGTTEDAMKRGRQIHLLLEHLPNIERSKWAKMAHALLGTGEDQADETTQTELLSVVKEILDTPDLSHLFTPDSLAEVAVSASLDQFPNRIFHGIIDRLIVTESTVLAVDYKTNRVVPKTSAQTPDGLKLQLAAYRAILSKIYPTKDIQTAILWTQSGELMGFDESLLVQSLERLDATALPT